MKKRRPATTRIRSGNVAIEIRQYADGRWGFDSYAHGAREKVRRKTVEKAEAAALGPYRHARRECITKRPGVHKVTAMLSAQSGMESSID